MERCPYGVSQHSVPLQWAQNVFSHGLIYWKWPTLIDVYGNTGFPGVEEPCVPDIAYSTGGQVSGWSQSPLQWAQKMCIHGFIQ